MTTEYSDNKKAADIIAGALYAAVHDLCVAMPNGIEPYDYSIQIKALCSHLSDITFQLERIADHYEAKG